MRWALAVLLLGGCRTVPAVRHSEKPTEWTRLSGPLFNDAPSPDDVFQGALNDCSLIAFFAATAATHPELIQQAIRPLEDGRFAVTLHVHDAAVEVVVDASVPTHHGAPVYAGTAPADFVRADARGRADENARPIWPVILEKAFAKQHGGYEAVDEEIFGVDRELTGWSTFTVRVRQKQPATTAAILTEAWKRAQIIVVGNAQRGPAAALGLKPAHGYAVVGWRDSEHGPILRLRNPTGERHGPHRDEALPVGQFELGLGDVVRAFQYVSITGHDFRQLQALFDADASPP